jgi:spore germination protein YaaH
MTRLDSRRALTRSLGVALAAALFLIHAPAVKAATPPPKLNINGQTYTDPLIQIQNDRLLVPVRFVSETLGAQVSWDGETRKVTIVQPGNWIVLWIGQQVALVNGKATRLDVPPVIVSDRTLLPYRFVGEALGAKVGWQSETRTAYLWTGTVDYQIQQGETLSEIAETFGMGLSQVAGLNEIADPNKIKAGDVIQVKPMQPVTQIHTVSGFTISDDPEDLRAQKDRLTDVATVSHRFTADGHLTGSRQTQVLAEARAHNKRTWLVVQNLDADGYFAGALAEALLADKAAQDRFIAAVLSVLKASGYTGLELNLEELDAGQRAALTAFLQRLKAALAPAGFPLSFALPAKTAADLEGYAGAYDYRAIGQVVDRVTLMTYNESSIYGPPGPVASLPWVERVLKYATKEIDPKKILLGVPGYGIAWPLAGGEGVAVNGSDTEEKLSRGLFSWDRTAGSPKVTYHGLDGIDRVLWYENAHSIRLKLQTAQRYGVQGIAIWRLGNEGSAVWNAFE